MRYMRKVGGLENTDMAVVFTLTLLSQLAALTFVPIAWYGYNQMHRCRFVVIIPIYMWINASKLYTLPSGYMMIFEVILGCLRLYVGCWRFYGTSLGKELLWQLMMSYDRVADVAESSLQWRSDFQSGSRVLKKVLWTFSYLYLWHTMSYIAKSRVT